MLLEQGGSQSCKHPMVDKLKVVIHENCVPNLSKISYLQLLKPGGMSI